MRQDSLYLSNAVVGKLFWARAASVSHETSKGRHLLKSGDALYDNAKYRQHG